MKKHIYVLLALCLIPSTLFSMGGWRKKRVDTTITLAEFQRRQAEADEKKRAEEVRKKEAAELAEQRRQLQEEAERAAIASRPTYIQMESAPSPEDDEYTPAAAPAAPTEPTNSPDTTESESDSDDNDGIPLVAEPTTTPAEPEDEKSEEPIAPEPTLPGDAAAVSGSSLQGKEYEGEAIELNDVGALSAAATESPEGPIAAVAEAGTPEKPSASASVVPSDETRAAVDALVAAAHAASQEAAAAAATPATEVPAAETKPHPYWDTLGITERMAYSLSFSNVGTSLSSLARLTPQSSPEDKLYVSRSLTHAIEEINRKLEAIALKYPNNDLHSLESRIAEEREQIKLLNILISEARDHGVDIHNTRMNMVIERADDHKALCIQRTRLTKEADRNGAAFAKALTKLALTRKTNKTDLSDDYISEEEYGTMAAFDTRTNRDSSTPVDKE